MQDGRFRVMWSRLASRFQTSPTQLCTQRCAIRCVASRKRNTASTTLRDLFAKWRAEGFCAPPVVWLSIERSNAMAVQVEDQHAGRRTHRLHQMGSSFRAVDVVLICLFCRVLTVWYCLCLYPPVRLFASPRHQTLWPPLYKLQTRCTCSSSHRSPR